MEKHQVEEQRFAPSAGIEASPAGIDAVFGGRLYCDLVFADVPVPGPGQEVHASDFVLTVGGVATRAIAAARLGMDSGIVAVLGTDPVSRLVRSLLEDEPRLRAHWIAEHPSARVAVTAVMTEGSDRSFVTYEDEASAMPSTLPAGATPDAGYCQIDLADAETDWVVRMRAGGTRVYGGVGWDVTGAWDGSDLERLTNVDAFILNEDEALAYTRSDNVEGAARVLAQRAGLVVVTLGAAGALAVDSARGQVERVYAPRVRAVDPTGAGDVFTAAFMTAEREAWPLQTALRFATLAASASVQSLGGASSAPRREQLAAALPEELPDEHWEPIAEWARKRITTGGQR
ncbi:PfkB family carbohydrate kinase [Humibacter ginsengisoli]